MENISFKIYSKENGRPYVHDLTKNTIPVHSDEAPDHFENYYTYKYLLDTQ